MMTKKDSSLGKFYQKITRFFFLKKNSPLMWGIFLLGGVGLVLWWISAPRDIVIGVVYSTNPSEQFMESKMLSAARAYADWYNETARGRKIRLVTATYLADPTVALGELKEQGALAVLGFPTSTSALEALPAAAHYKLPLISPSASSSLLSQGDDWFFRARSSTAEDARQMIALFGKVGITEIALISYSGNPGYVMPLLWDLKKRGEPRIARELFDLSIMDLEPFVDENPFDAPQGVLVVGPPIYSLWVAQKARYLWPSSEIVLSAWSLVGVIPEKSGDFPLEFSILGGDVFFSFLVDPEHPFVRYWNNRFVPGVDIQVNNTYLAFTLLLEALKESDFTGGDTLRERLGEYRKLSGLAGEEVEIDRYGDAHGTYFLYRFGPGGYEEVVSQ